jgi:hypothetical protein
MFAAEKGNPPPLRLAQFSGRKVRISQRGESFRCLAARKSLIRDPNSLFGE